MLVHAQFRTLMCLVLLLGNHNAALRLACTVGVIKNTRFRSVERPFNGATRPVPFPFPSRFFLIARKPCRSVFSRSVPSRSIERDHAPLIGYSRISEKISAMQSDALIAFANALGF